MSIKHSPFKEPSTVTKLSISKFQNRGRQSPLALTPNSAQILFNQRKIGQIRRDNIYERSSITQRFANIAKTEPPFHYANHTIKPRLAPLMEETVIETSDQLPHLVNTYVKTQRRPVVNPKYTQYNCPLTENSLNLEQIKRKQYSVV